MTEEITRGFDELVDTVWLACAIDGEGNVGLTNSKGSSFSNHYAPVIKITNTKKEFVEKASEIMKINLSYIMRSYKDGWKELYATVTGKQSKVKAVLIEVLPFLIIKREQAKLVLEWIQIRENSYLGKGIRGGSRSERETEIYNELKELNKRGRLM